MILVIGSRASGKRAYIQSLGYTDVQISDGTLDEKPVLYGLEQLVFAAPETAPALLSPLCEKEVVACGEVGSGIIPLEKADREAREATGRLCVQLAQRADKVIRLVAGIPTVIKG